MRHLAVCFWLVTGPLAWAQTTSLAGRLLDGAGAPVSYANVYYPAAATGAVCDEAGRFALVAAVGPRDSLRISCIGFRDTVVLATRFSGDAGRAALVLAKADYTLREAEVRAERYRWGPTQRLGVRARRFSLVTCTYAMGSYGMEMAAVVASDEVCHLDRVLVQSQSLTVPTMEVELNVYPLDGAGLPGAPLQRAPIRHTITQAMAESTVPIDVRDAGIVVDGAFAVSVEVISATDPAATLWVHMPCRAGRNAGLSRLSDGTWRQRDRAGAIYVEGRCAQQE